jgi:hypothetical protein
LAPVISATALTWPVFSAMRAMIAGMTTRTAAKEKVGRACRRSPCRRAIIVACGKPNQGAFGDPVEVDPPVRRGLASAGVEAGDLAEALVEQPRQDVAEDQRQEDRDPAEEALERHRADDREGHDDEGDPLVLRPVDVGDDRARG